jgi:glucokinase
MSAGTADNKIALGLDVGGTTFTVGAFHRDGSESCHDLLELPTPSGGRPEDVLAALESAALQMRDTCDDEVVGLGMGVPGVVDPATGHVHVCPNLPALNGVEAGEILAERLGLPVFIANDAHCATLAELRWGAGRDVENLVLLTLGTGIGGGVALDNKVSRGPRQILGEIGHLVVDPKGPRCGCGNHGCFEAHAGRDGIVNRTLRRVQEGKPTSLLARLGDDVKAIWDDIPRIVADEATRGDAVALDIMQETGFWIGVGICSALVLCDPDLVIIGGGISAAGDLLLDPIRRTVEARSRISRGKFDVGNIVRAQLGNRAGVCGAGALVWERLPQG